MVEIYPFLFILGTAIGSFLNVLIDRLPNEQSIMGRSHCDYCKKTLQGIDLVPIFSFVFLRGRCRYCRKKLSFFYPGVEILTGLVFILVWMLLGNSPIEKTLFLGVAATLIVIFFADVKYQIIPDSMQFTLLLFSFALNFFHGGDLASLLVKTFTGGLIVLAPILLLFLITKGRGMGFGDVKLAFVMGVLLGWQAGLAAIYVAFIFGGLVGAILLLTGKKKLRSKIAFGPFLVIGIVVLLFAKDSILPLFPHF